MVYCNLQKFIDIHILHACRVKKLMCVFYWVSNNCDLLYHKDLKILESIPNSMHTYGRVHGVRNGFEYLEVFIHCNYVACSNMITLTTDPMSHLFLRT